MQANLNDQEMFTVVVNDEEQYSLWAKGVPVPAGWKSAGFEGAKDECLRHIESVWVDMTPRSLRSLGAAAVESV